jgi:hypothetical protein
LVKTCGVTPTPSGSNRELLNSLTAIGHGFVNDHAAALSIAPRKDVKRRLNVIVSAADKLESAVRTDNSKVCFEIRRRLIAQAAQQCHADPEQPISGAERADATRKIDEIASIARTLRICAEAALKDLDVATGGRRADEASQALVEELMWIWATEWRMRPHALVSERASGLVISEFVRFIQAYCAIVKRGLTDEELASDPSLKHALHALETNELIARDRIKKAWQKLRRRAEKFLPK